MFSKITLILDTGSLVALFGLGLAISGLALLQKAIVAVVLGASDQSKSFVRSKGALLLLISMPFILFGLIIMLRSDKATLFFQDKLRLLSAMHLELLPELFS